MLSPTLVFVYMEPTIKISVNFCTFEKKILEKSFQFYSYEQISLNVHLPIFLVLLVFVY